MLGVPLPAAWVTEVYRFYDTVPAALDPAAAEDYGERILTAYLESLTAPYGTVSSTVCASRQEGDTLAVTLTAECVEEIAETAPVLTETKEAS